LRRITDEVKTSITKFKQNGSVGGYNKKEILTGKILMRKILMITKILNNNKLGDMINEICSLVLI